MKIFNLSGEWSIICKSEGTRTGFRHLAYLMKNGNEYDKAKVCYQNRTWERYEFETVIKKLLNQNQELNLKLEVLNKLNN